LPALLAIQDRLTETGVALSALTLHEPWYDRDIASTHRPALPQLLDGLAALEPQFCILSVPGSNERMSTAGWPNAIRFDSLSASDHATLVDTVQSVADMIRSVGVQVAFRPRLASFIETEDEIERFLEDTEPELVRLALDLGHLALMDIDPMALIQRHGGRIAYCYVRDLDEQLASDIHLGLRSLPSAAAAGLFVPPGEGYVPLRSALRRLLLGEVCQWYTLDLQPDTVDPREALHITFDYMQESEAWRD
jgi:inosose dehydratase